MNEDSEPVFAIWTSRAARLSVLGMGLVGALVVAIIQAYAGFEDADDVARFVLFVVVWVSISVRLALTRVVGTSGGILEVHNFFRNHAFKRSDLSRASLSIEGPALLRQEMVVLQTIDDKIIDLEATRRLRLGDRSAPNRTYVDTLNSWVKSTKADDD